MNEFESLDDMLNYVSDNADTILKNVDYDSNDPEGMKRALELKAMQELLDEMFAEGLIVLAYACLLRRQQTGHQCGCLLRRKQTGRQCRSCIKAGSHGDANRPLPPVALTVLLTNNSVSN